MNITLINIIKESSNPFLSEIGDNLDKHIARLEFLLWGNTDIYMGPLVDGFDEHEWISISLLLSDWLMEVLVSVNNSTSVSYEIIEELRTNPNQIAGLTLEILTKLIEKDVIKTNKKHEILLFLQNQLVINAVISHADELVEKVQNIITTTCGWCKNKKNITKITEMSGTKAYKASKALSQTTHRIKK